MVRGAFARGRGARSAERYGSRDGGDHGARAPVTGMACFSPLRPRPSLPCHAPGWGVFFSAVPPSHSVGAFLRHV